VPNNYIREILIDRPADDANKKGKEGKE